ncbi:acetyl-CoA carboxylase biotin carboxylase subunit [Sporomusa sp.]|uniref:acetyl-CoA carboxylase biotin carboxylase subunit n=1 Tax=Sporomusa sp. TaxID=2078658 RepID=UPI002BC20DE0|nr:acetyl-CoA carboxylase biotin carboxylase subunit [Sporomusa sp.]HWR42469.1 acetyl-CoA carboxylase biotin carboxylase subunit [Sporomusa sp.]
MFKRLLIANRGEIAVRIIRACQELGIETVAVYSDADSTALHVGLADYAIHIGPSEAELSYLNAATIVTAAKMADVDAVHPGYGFLSENAEFAKMVTESGLVFVGPSAETIERVGNKDAAREAMQTAGLPMAAGTNPLGSLGEAIQAAEEIGYPVMLKPVAGGGGRGMSAANNKTELVAAIKNLNQSSVAGTAYYLEKYIACARHIEVQIVSDNYGHIIHLGERECSLQRRNQKILEEAPSSALTPAMRQKVGELAVQAAKSVHYTNIGTVEFLLDASGNFYFMEINPRIQVEHAITEMITDIDLVKTQIQVAAGLPLTIQQQDVVISAHAIECRINAEDPELNFLPCPGKIEFYHQPGGPNVRVDSGVCAGSVIEPYYDSLIAKVIVRGKTRGEAIQTMQRALSEFRMSGIKTTVDFHKEILSNPCFRVGKIDIQFISKQMIS